MAFQLILPKLKNLTGDRCELGTSGVLESVAMLTKIFIYHS